MNLLRNFNSKFDNFAILDDYAQLEKSDKEKSLEKCIEYVCNSDFGRMFNDKRCQNAFKFMRWNCVGNIKHLNILLKYDKLIEIFSNIFVYYATELKLIPIDTCSRLELTVFDQLLSIILNSTNESKPFCYKFHDCGGTRELLNFMDDYSLTEKCSILKRKDVLLNNRPPSFLCAIVSSVFNLSSIADDRKTDFRNAIGIISNFLGNKNLHEDYRMCAYLTLANLYNDNEIERLENTSLVLNSLINLLRKATNSIVTKQNLNRIQIDIEVDNEKLYADVCVIEGIWFDWHIDEILNGLYRISINDKMKYEIYEKLSVKNDIKKIIFYGTDSEKLFAIKLLWQLSFDKKVANGIYEDKELYNWLLAFVQKSNNVRIRSLIELTKGVLWSIDKTRNSGETVVVGNVNQSVNEQNIVQKTKPAKKNHIMISYNSESRETCVKIKDELTKNGYKVWIDIDQIEGSSLESMANAIENSFCVLLCMSEKYKQSTNCRTEAEYIFKLGVPFLPLIMKPNYSPDGWLGIMIGTKIYVDFPKYGFEKAMEKVLNQLDLLRQKDGANPKEIKAPPRKSNSVVEERINVKDWSQKEVQEWLTQKQIDQNICKILKNFNGEMLKQLNSVKKSAPDYFFSAISQNNTIELFQVLKFTSDFENLFGKN